VPPSRPFPLQKSLLTHRPASIPIPALPPYTERVVNFPLVAIRRKQIAVLGLAHQMMALLEGTPLFDDFKDVLRKTLINLPGDFSKRFQEYRAAVSKALPWPAREQFYMAKQFLVIK
jgi:hypothetical protein